MVKNTLVMEMLKELPKYEVDQPRVPIFFVASPQDWTYCEELLLQAQVVGLDTETRPIFNKNLKPNPCSLLQIAVRDAQRNEQVFILDLLNLSPVLYNSTLSTIFLSDTILKLGQDFYRDLKGLAESYPDLPCFTSIRNIVEVNDLSCFVSGGHLLMSLQKLAFFYLHKKFVKTRQLSNWEMRPLSMAQRHYAASDALVLIHLYDEMLRRIKETPSTTFELRYATSYFDVNLSSAECATVGFKRAQSAKSHEQRDATTLNVF